MRKVNKKIENKKTNFFITDKEAKTIWKESAYYPKFRIMCGFALFRGLRIGEIRAINIRDFKNSNFNKMDIILQKSNIKDEFPIVEEFAAYLKKWIKGNLHTFRFGYLFPKREHNHTDEEPYLAKNTCNTMFYKFRRFRLIPKYPEFAEKIDYLDEKGSKVYYNRYRVGWHSMRRWFETRLWEKGYRIEQIANIMRYKDPKTVYTYLNPYRTWRQEANMLKDTFADFFDEAMPQEEKKEIVKWLRNQK